MRLVGENAQLDLYISWDTAVRGAVERYAVVIENYRAGKYPKHDSPQDELMNGIGQCMIPASASSLIAQYHTETRSTALSIYQTGLYFGILLASALSGVLSKFCPGMGWRWAL